MNLKKNLNTFFACCFITAIMQASPTKADDMELYVSENDTTTQHARVLILFDNSGSMSSTSGTSTRIKVAKSAIENIITNSSNVDWGLATFNYNAGTGQDNTSTTNNGGRIVRAIEGADDTTSTTDTDSSLKTAIISKIESLTASTNTPLSESMYEITHYFQGGSVKWGKWSGTTAQGGNPAYDPDALTSSSSSTYKSPLSECNYHDYLIIVTDGAPTLDTAANSLITSEYISKLTTSEITAYGTGVSYIDSNDSNKTKTSYLPVLAGYMKNKDLLSSVTGTQTVTTYTIGFGNDAMTNAKTLLTETATRGGGSYYPAADSSALTSALESILVDINKQQYSMTSVATASSSSDKTQYLTNLYYSEFVPSTGPRWTGNIKKLKYYTDSSGSSYIADANNNPAFDSEGKLQETAQTYWSSVIDGDSITEGGVQQMISQKTSRTLYTDNGSSLLPLTESNLLATAGSTTQLVADLGVASSTAVTNQVSWIQGKDIDGENTTSGLTYRETVFGEMMHGKPVVVDYGNDDVRLIASTNQGFLHMFKDAGSSVDETWAYIPYGLLGNQFVFRTNAVTATHTYGLDNTTVSYVLDSDNDGIIKSSSGDKVWLFASQRQGGRNIYALDATTPASPSLKWIIKGGTTAGFSRLAQTWSTPKVTKVPGYSKPVLIFGGGYSTNKDTSGVGTADTIGNAIYIVDADTGGSNFKFVISPDSTANLQKTTMTDSIAAPVTVMDSDGDGYTDRIYAADTGGNIWRVDLGSTTKTNWTIFKFSSLGSDTTAAQDRRFFGAPVIVNTINKQVVKNTDGSYSSSSVAFDAVLIGSGDRNKPVSDTSVKNGYFMLRDYQIAPYASASDIPSDTNAITVSNLYDITNNPLGTATTTDTKNSILVNLTNASGWVYWLSGSGEKIFGNGSVINGTLYFTSFTPSGDLTSNDSCNLTSVGNTNLYELNMHYGTYTGTTAYTTYENMLVEDLASYVSPTDKSINLLGTPGTAVSSTTTTNAYSGTLNTSGSTNPVMQFEYQKNAE